MLVFCLKINEYGTDTDTLPVQGWKCKDKKNRWDVKETDIIDLNVRA